MSVDCYEHFAPTELCFYLVSLLLCPNCKKLDEKLTQACELYEVNQVQLDTDC